MKRSLHKCACASCSRLVPVTLLMCVEHWRLVPAELQRTVWRTYRAKNDNASLMGDYLQAVEQAAAAVTKKLEKKAAARAGGTPGLF